MPIKTATLRRACKPIKPAPRRVEATLAELKDPTAAAGLALLAEHVLACCH